MADAEIYNERISEEVPNMPERLIKQSFEALEHNYDITQRAKMEAIHNGIVGVINDEQARPEHVLLVLDVLRSEIVNSCATMFFAPPPQAPRQKSEEREPVSIDGVEENPVE
jgi:hypothetical protein